MFIYVGIISHLRQFVQVCTFLLARFVQYSIVRTSLAAILCFACASPLSTQSPQKLETHTETIPAEGLCIHSETAYGDLDRFCHFVTRPPFGFLIPFLLAPRLTTPLIHLEGYCMFTHAFLTLYFAALCVFSSASPFSARNATMVHSLYVKSQSPEPFSFTASLIHTLPPPLLRCVRIVTNARETL